MIDFLTYPLALIVTLGVLVTVHEFGHFWVARRLGVKVLRFSVGFGKPLWRWRRKGDDTEYVVAMLPLGGYVRMLDEREGEVSPDEQHLAFNRKPLWVRTAVVAAGPIFNLAFAVLVYWAIAVMGTTEFKPVVRNVIPDSPAAVAGIQPGDEFVEIGGHSVIGWRQAMTELLDAAVSKETVPVTVLRNIDTRRELMLDLSQANPLGGSPNVLRDVGVKPAFPDPAPVLDRIEAGSAADQSGLQSGDRIVSMGGESFAYWSELVDFVRAHPGETVSTVVERNGARQEISVAIGSKTEGERTYGFLGTGPFVPEGFGEELRVEVSYGPVAAIGRGFKDAWDASTLTLTVIGKVIIGEASVKNLSGPLSIAQYAGESAKGGLIPFLQILAIISISLGVLNLLPIPVLDGGHLLFYAIEAVTGRPLSEKAQEFGYRLGLGALILLMGLAFYNDITRLVAS